MNVFFVIIVYVLIEVNVNIKYVFFVKLFCIVLEGLFGWGYIELILFVFMVIFGIMLFL